jgi:hypothetical protein
MEGVIYRPDGTSEARTFDDENMLEGLQAAVDGHIEVINFSGTTNEGISYDIDMVINEEGKILGKEINPIATMLYQIQFGPIDVIVGNAVLMEGRIP